MHVNYLFSIGFIFLKQPSAFRSPFLTPSVFSVLNFLLASSQNCPKIDAGDVYIFRLCSLLTGIHGNGYHYAKA